MASFTHTGHNINKGIRMLDFQNFDRHFRTTCLVSRKTFCCYNNRVPCLHPHLSPQKQLFQHQDHDLERNETWRCKTSSPSINLVNQVERHLREYQDDKCSLASLEKDGRPTQEENPKDDSYDCHDGQGCMSSCDDSSHFTLSMHLLASLSPSSPLLLSTSLCSSTSSSSSTSPSSSCFTKWSPSFLQIPHNHFMTSQVFLLKAWMMIFLTMIACLCNPVLVSGVPTSGEPCNFPSEWAGLWFLKGFPDGLKISRSEISGKGFCREISGDKFLIENRQERCVRCMVINQKHANILQYKETNCLPKPALRNLRDVCSEINGDAFLYSLFRLNTPSVSCPFSGPFKFSYRRGHGECREPMSSIDSCIDDSRLLFRFQACADIAGSESRVEELSCLGEWKEGSVRYLVGRMDHRSAKTDDDKFRCFVFERSKYSPDAYNIAQSGEATCDGLSSAIEGSRTMKLSPYPPVEPSCSFPSYLIGPKHWKTLDGSEIYDFSKESSFTVFSMNNASKLNIVTCVGHDTSRLRDENMEEFIVHSVSGCKVGFMCIRMYKRNNHVVEIEAGNNLVKDFSEDVCSSQQHFLQNYLPITTFRPELEDCPVEGIFSVEVPEDSGIISSSPSSDDASLFICSEQSVLTSKCSNPAHMQLLSRCSETENSNRNFYCHGNWKDNETTFSVVSSAEDKKQYCLTYSTVDIVSEDENEGPLLNTKTDQSQLRQKLRMEINSGSCPHGSRRYSSRQSSSSESLSGHFLPSSSLPSNLLSPAVKRGVLPLNLVDHGKCQSLTTSTSASAPRFFFLRDQHIISFLLLKVTLLFKLTIHRL